MPLHPHVCLIGKTIKSIDTKSCNLWTVYFTDETVYTVEAEAMGWGLYGPVLYSAAE